ncbi:hypothetical protein P8C59_009299 [Phyllachora maydis]|uniref:MAGE domain-containing protein n=1 Tax=Phyllachora maydis TaxID=1825666 RepID=A0AAD9MFH0_9PEZI|nr:hypothetical protein P8C59_009299 [Phyllachora maydis]
MTTEQKRKAAKSGTQPATSSNSYILCSVLDNRYRTPTIIGPAHVHSPDGEAAYTALYTTIISIIVLSDGELSDPRLRRYLTRLNAGESMPSTNPSGRRNNAAVEKTDVVLARMQRQGYLTKVTEPKAAGDEDTTTWFVGPRGKTEVDNESIALYLRKVYGGSTEELEKQLQASLKVKEVKPEKIEYERANPGRYARRDGQGEEEEEEEEEEESAGEEDGDPGPSTRGAKRRRQRDQTSDEEEDEDDE